MRKSNLFYFIFILTILTARIAIIIVPEVDMPFFGVIIHHFWFGATFLLVGLILSKKYETVKIYLSAVGTGLMVDQFFFIILGAGKDKEYWSLFSLLGAFFLAIIVYFLKTKITSFILRRHYKKPWFS